MPDNKLAPSLLDIFEGTKNSSLAPPVVKESANVLKDMKTSQNLIDQMVSTSKSDIARLPKVYNFKEDPASSKVGGNSISGPDPEAQKQTYSTKNEIGNLMSQIEDVGATSKDEFKWAKPYTFNTGLYNADFDRYYTHPLYDKLGFSPFRDNESLYNTNASWANDFSRMTKQFVGLTLDGAKSMWGGMDAEDFNRRMSIAQTSKGGVGGFATNLIGNTSFALGVLGDMAVESLALSAAIAATGGVGTPAVAPELISVLGRGGKAIKNLFGATEAFAGATEALNATRGAENMRKTWTAANMANKSFNVLNMANPLKNVTELGMGLATGAKGYKGLTNMAKVSTTAGAFMRDVIRVRGAFGEAKLEGDNVQIKLVNDLTQEYFDKNDKMPEGKDAARIYDLAKEGNFKDMMQNMGLLLLTNDMVFGKTLRGFTPKWMASAEKLGSLEADVIANTGWKATAGAKPFEKAPEGFKKFLVRNYWKQAPSKIALGAMTYGKANFFEGAQETMQDAISGGIDNYYNKIYHDPLLAGSKEQWASMYTGAAKQISGQGFETFLSGFLMGGILQVPQNAIMSQMPKFRKDYAQKKKDVDAKTDEIINAMNESVMKRGEFASGIEENLIAQRHLAKQMRGFEDLNDRKGYLDAKNASMWNHIHTLLKHNQYDTWLDSVKEMRDMSETELSEAWGPQQKGDHDSRSYHERLENTIQEAQGIKNSYEGFADQFQDLSEVEKYKEGSLPWMNETLKRQAYDDVRKHAAFGHYTFGKTIERMQSIMTDLGDKNKPLAKANMSDVTALFDEAQLSDLISSLHSQINVYKDGDAKQRGQASKLTSQLLDLNALSESIEAYSGLVDKVRESQLGPFTKEEQIAEANHTNTIIDSLKNNYLKYIKTLAKANNESVLDEKIYPSLNALMDYMELDKDQKSLAQFVNFIHQPENFLTTVNRQHLTRKEYMAKRKEIFAKGLEEYKSKLDTNDVVFNKIFDLGAYMPPSSFAALLKGGQDDRLVFADTATNNPILPGTVKYEKIMELVRDYRARNPIATEAPVVPVTEVEKKEQIVENLAITPYTPIELMPAELVSELKDIYDRYVYSLEGNVAPSFEEFIKTSTVVNTAISAFNTAKGNKDEILTSITPQIKILSGVIFNLGGGRKVRFNKENRHFEYINNQGNIITNLKLIENLAKKWSEMPGAVSGWWQVNLSNAERNTVRKIFDRYMNALMKGHADLDAAVVTPKYKIMEALRGTKFKTGSDVDNNTTDVSRSWFSPTGLSVDGLVERIQEDILEAGGVQYDESDIIEAIYELVNKFPNGIKKSDLDNEMDDMNPMKAIQNVENEFLGAYGLNLGVTLQKIEDLNLINYTEDEEVPEPTPVPTETGSKQEEVLPVIDIQETVIGEPKEEVTPTPVVEEITQETKDRIVTQANELYDYREENKIKLIPDDFDIITEARKNPTVESIAAFDKLYQEKTKGLTKPKPVDADLEEQKISAKNDINEYSDTDGYEEKPIDSILSLFPKHILDQLSKEVWIEKVKSSNDFTHLANSVKKHLGITIKRNISNPNTPSFKGKVWKDAELNEIFNEVKTKLAALEKPVEVPVIEKPLLQQIQETAANIDQSKDAGDNVSVEYYRAQLSELQFQWDSLMENQPKEKPVVPVVEVDKVPFDEKIAKAKTLKRLKEIDKEIAEVGQVYFLERGTDYFAQIKKQLADKKIEIATTVDPKSLKKGSELLMKDTAYFGKKGWAYVMDIEEDGTYYVAKMGDPMSVKTYTIEELKNAAYMKVTEEMTELPAQETSISSQTEKTSDQGMADTKAMTADAKKKIIVESKNKSSEDTGKDLFKPC